MNFLIIFSVVSLLVVSASTISRPLELALGVKHKFTTKKDEVNVFCYYGSGNTSDPSYLFSEVLIHVNETKGHKIPWYSIKGVSSDDFHSHLEDYMYLIMQRLGSTAVREIKQPYEVDSYIRDVVSACPNPLTAKTRSTCIMRFSTIGHACVKIISPSRSDRQLNLTIHVEENFNVNYLYSFLVGAVLFFCAGYLGYNIAFQVRYSSTTAYIYSICMIYMYIYVIMFIYLFIFIDHYAN